MKLLHSPEVSHGFRADFSTHFWGMSESLIQDGSMAKRLGWLLCHLLSLPVNIQCSAFFKSTNLSAWAKHTTSTYNTELKNQYHTVFAASSWCASSPPILDEHGNIWRKIEYVDMLELPTMFTMHMFTMSPQAQFSYESAAYQQNTQAHTQEAASLKQKCDLSRSVLSALTESSSPE